MALHSVQAPHLPVGCHIASEVLKWQEVQVLGKKDVASLKPLDATQDVPLTAHLSSLGKEFKLEA